MTYSLSRGRERCGMSNQEPRGVEPDPPMIDDADMCPCGRGKEEFLHYDMHPPYRMTPPMAWRCKACDDEYDGRTIVQFGGPPAIGRIQLEEREPPADQ